MCFDSQSKNLILSQLLETRVLNETIWEEKFIKTSLRKYTCHLQNFT